MFVLLADPLTYCHVQYLVAFHERGVDISQNLRTIQARTLAEANWLYMLYRRELDAVITDGYLPSRSTTSLPLVRKMAEDRKAGLFKGKIVVAMGDEFFSADLPLLEELREAGCDVAVDKSKAVTKLFELTKPSA